MARNISLANGKRRSAFTLVEILIVVVIMAVLAATIIPQFSSSVDDAKLNTATFNLNTLRSQVEHYRAQHDGDKPDSLLTKLTVKTDKDGTINATAGAYGPYLRAVPENSLTGKNTVKVITNDPAVSGDVTANNAGGWLYNVGTGGVWLDHEDYYEE